jgi:amphi-Trp domain-containing protein
MGDYRDEERLSRREAAERLTDIAYGLTAGGPIEMRIDGHSVKFPVGDDLVLKRESTSRGAGNRVTLELSWSTALVSRAPGPRPPGRCR